MDLTPDQKARIVENRRRLLISLEMLLRRQNSAVEVLQTSMPLEVLPHASQSNKLDILQWLGLEDLG